MLADVFLGLWSERRNEKSKKNRQIMMVAAKKRVKSSVFKVDTI